MRISGAQPQIATLDPRPSTLDLLMPSQPPFRMPCESVAGKPRYFFGSPFQHAIVQSLVDKYINTTQVPNLDGSANVPPYERFSLEASRPDCAPPGCDPGSGPCPQAWQPPFAANTFLKSGKVNLAVAHKRGFKAVQARKFHQGGVPFTEKELCDGPDTIFGCGLNALPAFIRIRSAQKQPNRTRYLQLAVSSVYKNTVWSYSGGIGTPTTTNDDLEFTQIIDQNSGLPALNISSPVSSASGAISDGSLGQIYFWNWNQIVERMTAIISPGFLNTNYTNNSATATDPFTGQLKEQVNWDLAAGSFTRTVYLWQGTPQQQLTTYTETVEVSAGQLSYTSTEITFNSDNSIAIQTDITITSTLSSPYKDRDVYNEAVNLLDEWDLTDDEQIPWRGDDRCGVGPLVSRDEKLTQNWLNDFWVKDYGSPIANSGGGPTMPDQHWEGNCNIIGAPDPDTGNAVVAVQLGPYDISGGPVIISGALDNPFTQGTLQPVTIRGTFPPGINVTINADNTISWAGTVAANGYWGVTFVCTCSVPKYSGAVLGAPLPAGYQNAFDFRFTDWRGCCIENEAGQSWSWYIRGWGMFLEDYNGISRAQLPEDATQWPNWFQAANKPQGAWLFYNDQGSYFPPGCINSNDAPSGALDRNALWICKYAEILDLWPAQNFGRPGGDEKFSYDETRVYCARNLSGAGAGSQWFITDSVGNSAPDGTDFSGIWGGASVDGFYNVASYAGAILTLGAKQFNVPSNWASRSGDSAVCFGKLRFPDAPSLLGRVAVTVDNTGKTFTFTNGQPQFAMSIAGTEAVDIYDQNMVLIAAAVAATRMDDSSFTTAAAYPKAAYVTLAGVKWYLNDADPKGDYVFLDWMSDFRNVGENARTNGKVDCNGNQIAQPTQNAGGGPVALPYASFAQTPGCVPFTPCAPKVVCISPNGEQFPNGKTYDFPPFLADGNDPASEPNQFYFDQVYGSKWWGFVQVTMTDLLWQAPHRPCGLDVAIGWQMDNAQCQDNTPTIHFYEYHPQVEARLTVPCNYGQNQDECAPALPAGTQIGWLSPVFHDAGDVAFPPIAGFADDGSPGGAGTAYLLHFAFCNDMVGGCHFNYSVPGC